MNTRSRTRSSLNGSAYLVEEMLLHHVFTRLDVKTLLRCRSVCKSWNRIICNPEFVRLHLNEQKNSQKLLFRRPIIINYYSIGFGQSDAVEVQVELRDSTLLPRYVGSYNGLVCIAVADKMLDSGYKLYLWNPTTRESKFIPHPSPYIHYFHMVGFVYDSTFNDYKVIRIFHTQTQTQTQTCALDIYSLKTNSWQIIKDAPPKVVTFKPYSRFQPRGFELNGFMYWHVYTGGQFSHYIHNSFIFGLSLRENTFTEITISQDMLGPSPTSSEIWDFRALGRCLAAFKLVKLKEFVMWTMKDPEKKQTKWDKFITLSLCLPEFQLTTVIKPIWFSMDGKVLLFIGEVTQQKFGLYDPRNGSVEFIQICGVKNFVLSNDVLEIAYIETLVSPNMFEQKTRRVRGRKKRKSCSHAASLL